MTVRVLVSIAALGLLVACSPKPVAPVAPPKYMTDTFTHCTWGQVSGKTLSIWSYACGPDSSSIHLIADDTLPGFALVSSGGVEDGSMMYWPVIRTFTKAAGDPIDAVLPQVRKLSPGPHTDECVLVPAKDPVDPDNKTRKVYQLAPTGALKAAWDKNEEAGGPMPPPCGLMGISFVGDRIFAVMADDPTKVVYMDMGSEVQIFDTQTLKSIPAK